MYILFTIKTIPIHRSRCVSRADSEFRSVLCRHHTVVKVYHGYTLASSHITAGIVEPPESTYLLFLGYVLLLID